MSASSKKKLRAAENAEKLTEKQLKERKEAKQLKTNTIIFVVVMALMVCFAVYTAVTNTVNHSGIFQRNTVAATVGDHEISNAELNFYYIDAVNNFYSNYGSYAAMFGLDMTKPLDQQVLDEETGKTWADDFIDSAIENAKAVYALNDAAAAAGFTLTEDQAAEVEITASNMRTYANMYGYPNVDDYLKAMYGNGANEEVFRNYYTMNTIASAYQTYYTENLEITAEDITAADKENPAKYSTFSYNSYYLPASSFLEGGTEGEDGVVTYSDEENAAALAACEEAANSLTSVTTAEELDAAIAALSINADNSAASSTAYTDTAYTSINSTIQEWVTASERKAGDVGLVPYTTHVHEEGEEHSEDEDAAAHEKVNGYYIVLFNGVNDNEFPLVNVRHILFGFEGGTTDENGNTTFSDEEKKAAKDKAEAILAQWQSGKATEDTFASLATENTTDPGSMDNGGLYEDVYPGQMVPNFNDWCFDAERKVGDTGIVETDYGYHVMFFSGYSDTIYRDMLIEEDLIATESENWYNSLVDAMETAKENTKYMNTDLVLQQQ